MHCAAERKVDVVENNLDGTLKLNVDATKNLAQISGKLFINQQKIFSKMNFFNYKAKLGILFIYISTDYVFDGTKPPYKIEDQPNPLNNYGISKYEGEKATNEASNSKFFKKYFSFIV